MLELPPPSVMVCISVLHVYAGRDSSLGIVTGYGLYAPGIESQCRRNFPHPSTPALRSNQRPVRLVLALVPGRKAAGTWP
jgi:hypothetical protein